MNNGIGFGGGPSRVRKRSRAGSSSSSGTPSHNGGSVPSSTATPSNRMSTPNGNNFILDKNERLLRLNVGGRAYDVVRTSLPLLETMMTDRWLSSCLVDSDGRIFIDRDGDAFGDILRYLRGGAEFLLQLVHSSSGGGGGGGLGNAALSAAGPSQSGAASNNADRLRRLRTEADYYGLYQLVHDIDVVTVGQKIVFDNNGWGRVAGGCLPRNRREGGRPLAENNDQIGNAAAVDGNGDDDANLPNEADGNVLQLGNAEDQNPEEEEELQDDDQMMNDNEIDNNDEEEAEDEDQALAEDDDDDEEEEDDDDDAQEGQEEVQLPPEEEDGQDGDPNRPPPYKFWSWSKQYGNPNILRPHPTHTSSMVVGQDGSYLLLLRLAAALPSPLARIRWDQEEEEGRRVTRAALRRSSRRRPSIEDGGADTDFPTNDADGSRSPGGRSRELEEDYFVTVNIEAPLQTVMDSVDESQTHFPLLRAGLWDYRTEEEVREEDPVFATFCAMDVVSLREGDVLSVSFMNDEVSRERSPFPDNSPPDLFNSLTLVRVTGNTLARYERLRSSPEPPGLAERMRTNTVPLGGDRMVSSPSRRSSKGQSESSDDSGEPRGEEAKGAEEEMDRSLARTAHWVRPRNDFPPTPFHPPLRSRSSVIEFPHPGHYLLLGRVALGCRRDAAFRSVLRGGPAEGHRAQLAVRSAGGRLLHSLGFVFEDRPRLEWADLSVLSENAAFNDVVHVPRGGTELSVATTGDCRLHPEGTEAGPFCSAVSQSLSCLLLDDEIMEVDRYMVGTMRNASLNTREVKWFHTRSASAPPGQGRGGALGRPSLFDVDGHRLVWRGHRCDSARGAGTSPGESGSSATVLVVGSIPPLRRGYVLGLMKNDDPISISITPESLDVKGRHCHYFQEVVELEDGDEVTVAEVAYGGGDDDDDEGGDGGSWREQLHVESRLVEFDTRIGHLSFVVLRCATEQEAEGGY